MNGLTPRRRPLRRKGNHAVNGHSCTDASSSQANASISSEAPLSVTMRASMYRRVDRSASTPRACCLASLSAALSTAVSASPCRYLVPARWVNIRENALAFCDRFGAEAPRLRRHCNIHQS